MQPLRKQSDPALGAPPVDGATERHAIVVDDDLVFDADSDIPVSPVLLLRQQLAARLAEAASSGQAGVAVANEPANDKWPIAMRLTTIATISLALWSGIVLAIWNITTK